MIVEEQKTVGNSLAGRLKFPSKTAIITLFGDADGFFEPVLGPLLQRRRIVALLATAVFGMVALAAMGITAWQCPLRSTLGIPCPGCGLTRAMVLFVQGNWQASISLHVFAPIVLAVGILLAAGSALPARPRQELVAWVTDLERRTGITALLVLSALIYWALRIFHLIQTA
jgi:Protein of unknown function (DUF2752)